MVDERDVKRAMIPIGTGADQGRRVLKDGDDVPATDAAAPKISEPNNGSGPVPITLQAMARYIRSLTSDGRDGNVYSVSDAQAVFNLRDAAGRPAPLVTPNAGVFAPADLLLQLGAIGETFDSETLQKLRDPRTGFNDVLRMFISNPQGELQKLGGVSEHVGNGRASVATPDKAPDIQKKVSAVLLRNRFNPNPDQSPYATTPVASEFDRHPVGKLQRALGGYDNNPVDATTGITYEQMKKVGFALMLRATGNFIAKDGPSSADLTAWHRAADAAALIPGSAQLLATRIIDPKSMWAADLSSTQGRPPGYELRSALESDLTLDNGTSSYGNLNSYVATFDGFAPLAMIALGVALVLAVKLLVEGFLLGLNGIFSVSIDDTTLPNSDQMIQPLGATRYSSKLAGGLITLEDFGIHTVRHDYLTAVNRGIDVFFQLDDFGDYVRVIKSPGYYAVMVRGIIRSGGAIVRAFADIVGSITNPVGALQALSGLMDVIKDSTLIGFINMLAGLGDTVLYLEDDGFISRGALGSLGDAGSATEDGKISAIDRLADNAITHARKSRAVQGATALAWRTSSTPSMYLLPESAKAAASVLSKDKSSLGGVAGLQDAGVVTADGTVTRFTLEGTAGRIDGDSVKLIEDHLESEYVPFYFHDLRTNEVVSFHAFLSSVTDSYTANYSRDKYYGRIDPVMVYSDTDRSINLSFNIVSTNPGDFDVMWWKVNKLITLLYPQWSRGRKLEINQNAFVQPFSQVPTSSPMVRLRLGDIFRSNYSKFALARLFGLGTKDFSLAGATAAVDNDRNAKLNDEIGKMTTRMLTDPKGSATPDDAGYAEGEQALLKANEHRDGPLAMASALPSLPGQAKPRRLQNTQTDLAVNITKVAQGTATTAKGKVATTFYHITVEDELPPGVSSGPYVIDFNDIKPDPDFIRSRAMAKLGLDTAPTAEQQAVEDFFTGEPTSDGSGGNVIVRSFESVRGRGLAGFVTSMSFDWKSPTWEKDPGSRAPQYCTVTMGFQPVHDIAPGIDDDGFNRAPVYNVGRIVNEVASDPYGDDQAARDIYKKNADAVEKAFQTDDIDVPL